MYTVHGGAPTPGSRHTFLMIFRKYRPNSISWVGGSSSKVAADCSITGNIYDGYNTLIEKDTSASVVLDELGGNSSRSSIAAHFRNKALILDNELLTLSL